MNCEWFLLQLHLLCFLVTKLYDDQMAIYADLIGNAEVIPSLS